VTFWDDADLMYRRKGKRKEISATLIFDVLDKISALPSFREAGSSLPRSRILGTALSTQSWTLQARFLKRGDIKRRNILLLRHLTAEEWLLPPVQYGYPF